jgi:NSS family neurotransmitter:Na+ symporter
MQITSKLSSAATNEDTAQGPEHWRSRFTFLMASVGFAVGLGNIWKFPYVTGENGGGAFVLIYLLCAFGIGVPILMAEILIGRRGQHSPNVSMGHVAQQESASPKWHWLGAMTMLTAFLILIIYCVIAGWVLQYLSIAVMDGFTGFNTGNSTALFADVLASPTTMLVWTALALGLAGLIVSAGLQKGIERAVTILMPLLFIFLVIMVGYAAYAGAFAQAIDFLFNPDFSKISASTVLIAVGQAFFSIGVAMAAMMTYGAYLPKQVSIGRSAVMIVFADTLVALLAGLAIFPLVFQHGIDPQGGPGLIFEALPLAFAHMPAGHLFSIIFFTLLSVAAITSMVGLLEPLVVWAHEHKGLSRRQSTWCGCLIILLLSTFSILSYNHWAGVMPLSWLPGFADKNLTDVIGVLTDQVTLPVGGLLIAIFAGWIMQRSSTFEELGLSPKVYGIWRFLIRYIAPVAVLLMLIMGITE